MAEKKKTDKKSPDKTKDKGKNEEEAAADILVGGILPIDAEDVKELSEEQLNDARQLQFLLEKASPSQKFILSKLITAKILAEGGIEYFKKDRKLLAFGLSPIPLSILVAMVKAYSEVFKDDLFRKLLWESLQDKIDLKDFQVYFYYDKKRDRIKLNTWRLADDAVRNVGTLLTQLGRATYGVLKNPGRLLKQGRKFVVNSLKDVWRNRRSIAYQAFKTVQAARVYYFDNFKNSTELLAITVGLLFAPFIPMAPLFILPALIANIVLMDENGRSFIGRQYDRTSAFIKRRYQSLQQRFKSWRQKDKNDKRSLRQRWQDFTRSLLNNTKRTAKIVGQSFNFVTFSVLRPVERVLYGLHNFVVGSFARIKIGKFNLNNLHNYKIRESYLVRKFPETSQRVIKNLRDPIGSKIKGAFLGIEMIAKFAIFGVLRPTVNIGYFMLGVLGIGQQKKISHVGNVTRFTASKIFKAGWGITNQLLRTGTHIIAWFSFGKVDHRKTFLPKLKDSFNKHWKNPDYLAFSKRVAGDVKQGTKEARQRYDNFFKARGYGSSITEEIEDFLDEPDDKAFEYIRFAFKKAFELGKESQKTTQEIAKKKVGDNIQRQKKKKARKPLLFGIS